MSVKERIKEFAKSKKISIREFERLSGLNYGYVNAIRVSIQPDKLEGIASHFDDLNVEWLLTGEGEMLKKKNNSIVSEPTVSYGEKESEGVTAISIIDRNSRSIEKMVEIADRNSRSIQQLVDSNMKLIELLHQNGIIISDETRKGGFYDSKEGKEGQSRNTRTTQAG